MCTYCFRVLLLPQAVLAPRDARLAPRGPRAVPSSTVTRTGVLTICAPYFSTDKTRALKCQCCFLSPFLSIHLSLFSFCHPLYCSWLFSLLLLLLRSCYLGFSMSICFSALSYSTLQLFRPSFMACIYRTKAPHPTKKKGPPKKKQTSNQICPIWMFANDSKPAVTATASKILRLPLHLRSTFLSTSPFFVPPSPTLAPDAKTALCLLRL